MTDKITPNNIPETMAYCLAQHEHLDPPMQYGDTWQGDCQAFNHVARGLLGGGFGSALLQFFGLDPEDRLTMEELNSSLDNAPDGSSLFSKGSSPFGHVYIARRPFKDGRKGAWGTDLPKTGHVGAFLRDAPLTVWGHTPLGAGLSVNGYALDLSGKNPPKPKQNKRYERIHRGIENLSHGLDDMIALRANLGHALDTARETHDREDADHLRAEIARTRKMITHTRDEIERLQGLYTRIRHA